MLIILLYHQISPLALYDQQPFKEHLAYLVHNFNIVKVGDPLRTDALNICLTFDDAYFDFYCYVYPLLRQYKVPAVLGIPAQFIVEQAEQPVAKRLAITYPKGLAADTQLCNPLCSWQEIAEMTISTFVVPASHSLTHVNLMNLTMDKLLHEVRQSKKIIEEMLTTSIDTFIYPFGKMAIKTHRVVQEHYKYAMRIGNAINYAWEPLLYRIDVNNFWLQDTKLTAQKLLRHKWNFIYNKLRGK